MQTLTTERDKGCNTTIYLWNFKNMFELFTGVEQIRAFLDIVCIPLSKLNSVKAFFHFFFPPSVQMALHTVQKSTKPWHKWSLCAFRDSITYRSPTPTFPEKEIKKTFSSMIKVSLCAGFRNVWLWLKSLLCK